jgi:hypothetical protein
MQEPKQTNGGREQAWLDTLSENERSLIRYMRGMTPDMRESWLVVKVAKIENVLDSYTAKALSAQSTATNTALAAANPPAVIDGKGSWIVTKQQQAYAFTLGGGFIVGIVAGGHLLHFW